MEIEFAYQRLDDIPVEIPNFHRTKPWGTAHAVYSARDHLRTPFVIINADDFYGQRAWEQMADSVRNTPSANALIAFRLDHTLPSAGPVARGICRVNGSNLIKIEEFSHVVRSHGSIRDLGRGECFSGDEPTSLNFWYLQPEVLRAMDFKRFFADGGNLAEAEWMLPVALQNLLDEEKIRITVINTQSHWAGITHPDDAKDVTRCIETATRSGAYPEILWRVQSPVSSGRMFS
jgi:dTDP-glucose pyrophosphorylase